MTFEITPALMLLLLLVTRLVSAQEIGSVFLEVPNGLITQEGNGESRLPFGYPSPVRYQQVYDASQFSRVPAGGAFLTRIFPRPDCSNTFEWRVTNLQVRISTTL